MTRTFISQGSVFEERWVLASGGRRPAVGVLVLREYFADARPTATMMVVGLASAAMKIEIEVTALKAERQPALPPDEVSA